VAFFALSSVTWAPAQIAEGLDDSWMAVLHYGREHGFRFGSDVVFTYGPLGFALFLLTAGEAIPVHLLVARSSPRLAWALTALAAYGLLWFVADARAARRRPVLLDAETLLVRAGLRWTIRIPRLRVVALRDRPPAAGEPSVRAALPTTRPLWLELAEPVVAHGLYGREKLVRFVGVAVDDARALQAELAPATP